MSVLIKGMEMPQNCNGCPLFESKYHFHGCLAKPKSINNMDMWNFVDDRPTWCPLIEVEEEIIIKVDEEPVWKRIVAYAEEYGKHIPNEVVRKVEAVICETVCKEDDDD